MPKRTSVTPNEISLLITPFAVLRRPDEIAGASWSPLPPNGRHRRMQEKLADYMQMQLRIDHLVAPTGFEPVLPP